MLPTNSSNRRRHTRPPLTNILDDNPLDIENLDQVIGGVVRTFSVPTSIRSSFHVQHPHSSNQDDDASRPPHHPGHHHHHHDDSKAVSYELKLYLKYLAVYVVLEFLLIYLNLLEFTDLVFILVILKSTYDDLAYGPRCDKIHTLRGKIYLISWILIFLFVTVFASGCFTDQFVEEEPVEIQVEDDGKDDDDSSPAIASDEILQIWKWIYKGFGTVKFEGDNAVVQQENQNGSIDWQQSGLFAGIHVVVCASKLGVVRFLLLEWELTVKSVTRFVRTL